MRRISLKKYLNKFKNNITHLKNFEQFPMFQPFYLQDDGQQLKNILIILLSPRLRKYSILFIFNFHTYYDESLRQQQNYYKNHVQKML